MNNYYFTFGVGQKILKKYFVKITAETEGDARIIMYENFGSKWSWCYSEEEWKKENIEETYGYRELEY